MYQNTQDRAVGYCGEFCVVLGFLIGQHLFLPERPESCRWIYAPTCTNWMALSFFIFQTRRRRLFGENRCCSEPLLPLSGARYIFRTKTGMPSRFTFDMFRSSVSSILYLPFALLFSLASPLALSFSFLLCMLALVEILDLVIPNNNQLFTNILLYCRPT